MTERVKLRPVLPEEFQAFVQASSQRYVQDMIAHAGMSASEAEAKAARDSAETLPSGFTTPGHAFFFIVDSESGAPIGRVWVAERPSVLFLYEIALDEAMRGRGLGRQAMQLIEAEAIQRGLVRVELNVFGDNHRARGLYRALGFDEVAIYMRKDVSPR